MELNTDNELDQDEKKKLKKYDIERTDELAFAAALDEVDFLTGFRKNPLILALDRSLSDDEFRLLLILDATLQKQGHSGLRDNVIHYSQNNLHMQEFEINRIYEQLHTWAHKKSDL